MRPWTAVGSCLLGAVLLAPGSAPAQGSRGKEPAARDGKGVSVEIVFTRDERTILSDWFRDPRNSLPPGLAKRDRLTPGHEKQLRRNGTLPPGLQKKLHPLPPVLETRMRTLPGGYIRVVLGRHVLLVEGRTGLIHDLVKDIVP